MASLFDVFTNQNAQDAANAQIGGIQQGQTAANANINQGSAALTTAAGQANNALTTNFGQAAGAFQPLAAAGSAGTNQLLAALGIGGPGGAAGGNAITQLLQNSPGYQFQMDQGAQNVLRNGAQTGTLASGGTLNALQTQGQGLANSTYQQYINNLQPFLGATSNAAGGISNAYTGLGTGLANVATGLGQGLNQNSGNQANLNYTAATGQGNAQANADLANNQASANMWGALLGGGKLLASAAGGGGTLGGFGSLLPASGSYSGAGAWGPPTLSDERAKTEKEKIGELYDGTNVYSFKYDRAIDPSGKTHVGLMAQEVERATPGAVKEFAGVKFVDYGKATAPARAARDAFDVFLKAA